MVKIAIVGDVHEQWESADGDALKALGVELVIFVGDFGNESIDVVRQIAALDLPKVAIMGNHDAWYTATPWGQKRAPYDITTEDRVQRQLDLLGEDCLNYSVRDFPQFNLSVVGARPFSWGGSEWINLDFYRDRCGVTSLEESTEKIVQAVEASACEHVILVGHNGPKGLGDQPEDICGKDWNPIGGDHGDPDFGQAIAQLKAQGQSIALVTFGHMHHTLRHRKDITRRTCQTVADTVYLNAACVPRIIRAAGETDRRNFSIVELQDGQVQQASLVWATSTGEISSQHVLYCAKNLI